MLSLRRKPAPQSSRLIPLTRKEFYELAESCRVYAVELADHNPSRVDLTQCHKFNAWLAKVKSYDLLAERLRPLAAARPVARWQLLVLAISIWLVLAIALPGRADRTTTVLILNSAVFVLFGLFMIPEGFYGTTVEMIEGRVLRVVLALEEVLQANSLQLSEAAYFRAKETLAQAHLELRQQIDLAHRN
jgi:hypothetical protein